MGICCSSSNTDTEQHNTHDTVKHGWIEPNNPPNSITSVVHTHTTSLIKKTTVVPVTIPTTNANTNDIQSGSKYLSVRDGTVSPVTSARQSIRSMQSRRKTRISTTDSEKKIVLSTVPAPSKNSVMTEHGVKSVVKPSYTDDGWQPAVIQSLSSKRKPAVHDTIQSYKNRFDVKDDGIGSIRHSKHRHSSKRSTHRTSVPSIHDVSPIIHNVNTRNSMLKLHRQQNTVKLQYCIFDTLYKPYLNSYCIDIDTCTNEQLHTYTIQLQQCSHFNTIELRSLAIVDHSIIQHNIDVISKSMLQMQSICNLTLTMSLLDMYATLRTLCGIKTTMLTLQPTKVPVNNFDVITFVKTIHQFSPTIHALNLTSTNWPDSTLLQLYHTLSNNKLTHILLSNVQLHDLTVRYIDSIINNTTIAHLDLSNIIFDDVSLRKLAEHLAFNTTITHCILDSTMSNSIQSSMFLSIMHTNKTLNHLSLANNHITPDGMHNLAKHVKHNTALQYLNLNNNQIQFDGVRTLVDCITPTCQLHTLLLSDNNIGPQGSLFLTDTLSTHCSTRLRQLDLSNNNIEHPNQIIRLLTACPQLLHCYYSDNNFGSKGKNKIAAIIQQRQREQYMNVFLYGCHTAIGQNSALQIFNTDMHNNKILFQDLLDYAFGTVDTDANNRDSMPTGQTIEQVDVT